MSGQWDDDEATGDLVTLGWIFFGIPLVFFLVWMLWGAR